MVLVLSLSLKRYFNFGNPFCKYLFWFILAGQIVVCPYIAAAPANNDKIAGKNQELARVAILPIENKTGSENFQYLSESLTDAINDSMQKSFTYTKIGANEINKAVRDVETAILLKEKIENEKGDKKPEKKLSEKELAAESEKKQLEKIQALSDALNADIIIYGNYMMDENTNDMIFHTNFYLGMAKTLKPIPETRNQVDSTIFTATDKVAKTIIGVIKMTAAVSEKHEKFKEKEKTKEASAKDKPKTDSGEKMVLTRASAKESAKESVKESVKDPGDLNWDHKKISIGLSPGFFIKVPSKGAAASGLCGACEIQLALNGRFWVMPRLYVGGKLDYGEIWTKTLTLGSIHALDGLAFIGYGLPVHQWLFSADLGAGYFFIIDKTKGLIYNPAFAVKVGAEILLAPSFSLGLSANGFMYYDLPTPMYFYGLTLSLNYLL